MDEVAAGVVLCENNARGGGLDGARKLAMRNIDTFVQAFSDQPTLQAATVSWAPSFLAAVAESARIQEAGHLRCRYILQNCEVKDFRISKNLSVK